MAVKSSISLTDEQDAFARDLVNQGRYSSLSAVLQQALELLRSRTEDEELEREALRTLLLQRSKGPFLSAEEFSDTVDALIAKKRAEYGI